MDTLPPDKISANLRKTAEETLRDALAATGKTVLSGHKASVSAVAFSPDEWTLASGSRENTVRLWDLANPGADPHILRGHESFVSAVEFSPDG